MKMKSTVLLLLSLDVVFSNSSPENEFTKANNLFGASVYKEVIKSSEGNLLVNPLSAEIVLSLTQSGAKGETAEEMKTALRLPSSNEKIQNEIKALLPTIKSNENYDFHTANKVYVKENYEIKDSFRKTAVDVYQSEIENIDFTKNVEAAKAMNEWVEKQTANKIRNLIDPGILNELTRIILINALYFKAKWQISFPDFSTVKRNFYETSEKTIKVDTMGLYMQPFNYYECSELNAKFLELPYTGGDASLTIVLPNAIEGLSTLENQIEKVLVPHDFKRELVNVALPKFKIEKTIDFKPVLKNLGMVKVFDGSLADFSGMAGEKGDLVISDVIQKTFIDVSEEGTEAAAATTVGIVTLSLSSSDDRKPFKKFIADHPFLFYVKVKNITIFVGRVTSPQY